VDRFGVVSGMVQSNWVAVMALVVLQGCGGGDFSTTSVPAETGGAKSTVESSGGAATGGEAIDASGAPATGGAVATGGASGATGGTVATGGRPATGGAPGAAGSCLVTMKAGCSLCGDVWQIETGIAERLAECKKVVDCWVTNSCGPNDACSQNPATCSPVGLGVGAGTFAAAVSTYDCSCG
jgi:hypothetical protein